MDSQQRALLSLKNQLQQPAAAGDRTSRCEPEIRPANFVVEALLPALLLRQSGAGGLRHSIDRRDRSRIDRSLEGNAEGMTDRGPPLLHGYRSESGSEDVTGRIDAAGRSPEMRVYRNPSAGVGANSGPFQTQPFSIG